MSRQLPLVPLIALIASLSACDGGSSEPWVPSETGDTDEPVDADGDGFDETQDCDDDNEDVNPGQAEICNEIDDNCDDYIDEGFDRDGDGHFSARECPFGDDCDDSDRDINPDAEEIPYNRIDEDCDQEDLTDVDGDGFEGEEVDGLDCNDEDAAINPDADEIPYDGIDQDCTGADLLDVDLDGHDSAEYGGDDCDDTDPMFNPSRVDWANDGIDHDCDLEDGANADLRLSRAGYRLQATDTSSQGLVGNDVLICDFDGDDADDVVITAPFIESYQGQVGIYLSTFVNLWDGDMTYEEGPDVVFNGSGGNAFFGMNALCGDIDGDGRDDLVLTKGEINYRQSSWTPLYDSDFMMLIYYGDDDWSYTMDERRADVQWTANLWTETSTTDSSVRSPSVDVGDLDGDGKDDIVIGFGQGTWPAIDSDTVYIIGGRRYSTWDELEKIEKTTLTMSDPVASGFTTGLQVAVTPDANGDSLDDLVVSQGGYQTNIDSGDGDPVFEGRMMLFSGVTEDGTLEDSSYAHYVGAPNEYLGLGAVAVADVDGSGAPDLIFGVSYADGGADTEGGELRVLFDPSISAGYDKDLAADADVIVYSSEDFSRLGTNVVSAGDVNGDGYDDLMVREQNFIESGSANDTVWIVSGARLTADIHVEDAFLLSFDSESGAARTGTGLAVGDVTDDGAPDFFIGAPGYPTSGRAYLYPSGSYPWGYLEGIVLDE